MSVCGGVESSSPCHGEDRGFKSRQTRWNGTVRKLEKRRSSNLRDFAGSTPALATSARSSIGSGQQPLTLQRRVQFGHCREERWSGSLGSFDQVVQLVDTRRSERRARSGLGVRLSPWSLVM